MRVQFIALDSAPQVPDLTHVAECFVIGRRVDYRDDKGNCLTLRLPDRSNYAVRIIDADPLELTEREAQDILLGKRDG